MEINSYLKYTIFAGIFAVLFIPFFVADSLLFPFITGKAFTFRIIVEIIFGIWLILMFRDQNFRPRFSWIMGAVLAFVSIITLADIAGSGLYKSFWSNFERMDGLITTLHLLAYFIVAGSMLRSRATWQYFFNTSVVASVIMSLYVFLQLAGKIVINQGGVRVDGTFGNATYLAVYMLFNFFITLFLILQTYQNSNRSSRGYLFAFYAVALAFQTIVIYFTATRGAILGLIGGLLVTALAIAIFERNRPAIRKIALGSLIAVMVLIGGFVALRNTDFVRESTTLGRFASLSFKEISTQGRRYVWPMAVSGFLEKPVLGWGQENFNYVFNKYYDPRMFNQEPWFDRAHNIVLDWLIAGGALGLLGYISIFGALIISVWKSKNFTVPEKSVLIGLVSAYFFQNLFVFDNLISYVYFFSLLAFVHSDRTQGKSEPIWITRLSEKRTLAQSVAPVVVLIFLVMTVYFLNVKPLLASRTIIDGLRIVSVPSQSLERFKKIFSYETFADAEASEQLMGLMDKILNSNADEETKKGFMVLALDGMKAQTERFDGDARYLLFMGSLDNRLGDHKGALAYLERAREASPRKQKIIQEIGLAYLSIGDYPKAMEQFRAAYDLAPEYGESIVLYGISALYNKNLPLAREIFAKLGNGVISDERIIAAYADTGSLAEAVSLIEKKAQADPNNPALRFRIAAGYLQLGQRTKSIEILREVISKFPEHKGQAEFYIKEIQAGRNP